MSEQGDKDSKTEEATERRRSEALEHQGGPFSREVPSAAILLAVSMLLATSVPGLVARTAQQLAVFIEDPGGWRLENGDDAILLLQTVLTAVSGLLITFAGVVAAAAIAASVLQNAPRFHFDRIAPDPSRISINAGIDRLFNVQGVIEMLKGLAKVALVGLAAAWGLGGIATGFYILHGTPDAIPQLIGRLVLRVFFISALFSTAIAAADFFMTRHTWSAQLRMSKQELKEELKQSEGDPMLKARLRAIARARIRRRMMQNVPKATLVVANPTHYAVALRYVKGEDAAPRVMAKGQDAFALKIREIAERHNVPVVEDKLLAKTLFDATEVDQLIPPEFYKAVAEIIIYLSSKSRPGQRKPRKDGPPPSSKPH
ncbi:MAG: flagellar biosynthesis protein FlhB [Rhodomicrobium sp.]